MHALRLTLVAALAAGLTLSNFETSAALARSAGTGATGAAGAAGGPGGGSGSAGASGGSAGPGGGGGPGLKAAFDREPPRPRPFDSRPVTRSSGSCFKQGELYDRYGYAVVNIYGDECFD